MSAYLIRAAGTDFIKIGYAANPARRISVLATSAPACGQRARSETMPRSGRRPARKLRRRRPMIPPGSCVSVSMATGRRESISPTGGR